MLILRMNRKKCKDRIHIRPRYIFAFLLPKSFYNKVNVNIFCIKCVQDLLLFQRSISVVVVVVVCLFVYLFVCLFF